MRLYVLYTYPADQYAKVCPMGYRSNATLWPTFPPIRLAHRGQRPLQYSTLPSLGSSGVPTAKWSDLFHRYSPSWDSSSCHWLVFSFPMCRREMWSSLDESKSQKTAIWNHWRAEESSEQNISIWMIPGRKVWTDWDPFNNWFVLAKLFGRIDMWMPIEMPPKVLTELEIKFQELLTFVGINQVRAK